MASATERATRTEWAVATLGDGAEVLIRPSRPDDAERLRRMFYRLSSTTIYRRFFTGAPHVPQWAERVASLGVADGERKYALVAFSGDETVGIAHYMRLEPGDTGEVGILIEDAWQGRGLGGMLLERLAAAAMSRGIATFTGSVLGENRRAARLVAKTFAGAAFTWSDGEYAVRVLLGRQPGEGM
jgi:acetyltransferase